MEKDQDNRSEEKYCDEFAAFILVPEKLLKNAVKGIPITTLKQLRDISKWFGVSKLVTIIQMKTLGIITPNQFKSLKLKLEAVPNTKFGRRN